MRMNSLFRRLADWVEGEPSSSREPEAPKESREEPTSDRRYRERDLPERARNWLINNETRVYARISGVLSVALALLIISCLLMTVAALPAFGDPDNPANNEVSQKYIEDSLEDTGAVNIVAGMILDYRAFDTFGESTVLFVAVASVIVLLRRDREKKGRDATAVMFQPKGDIILKKVARLLVPASLVFGIYVVLNGHLSPGGGFSGGTVLGAALILYYLAFGSMWLQRFFTYKVFNIVTVSALGFYALAKSYSFYTGANHLHSVISTGTPGDIFSAGLILPLNIAVGMVVACTMFGFYSLFDREDI